VVFGGTALAYNLRQRGISPSAIRAEADLMGKSRLLGAGLVAAALVIGTGMEPVIASAAGAAHTTTSSLGAIASVEIRGADTVELAVVSGTVVDVATGQASLWIDQSSWRTDQDGNTTDEISSVSGSGLVQFDVDPQLATAHAYGIMDVTRCDYDSTGGCSPTAYQATIDAVWSAASPKRHSHILTIGAVSRTSRTMYHSGSTYRFANAVVSIDGVSLGTTASPAAANIYDTRESQADFYFGPAALLPGSVGAIGPAATIGSWQAAGPREHGRGPGWSLRDSMLTGWWSLDDGSVQTQRWFGSEAGQSKKANESYEINRAWYGEQVASNSWQDNYMFISSLELYGEGSLTIGSRLDQAGFSGTLSGQACTGLSAWEKVCIDTSLPVTMAFAATQPLIRTVGSQLAWAEDGSKAQEHYIDQQRAGIVTGTVDGQPVAAGDAGVSDHEGHTDITVG
jgi:hypothetical protein